MDLNESELNDLRNNIREIDKDLVSLFEKRLTLSKAVAAYKLKAENCFNMYRKSRILSDGTRC